MTATIILPLVLAAAPGPQRPPAAVAPGEAIVRFVDGSPGRPPAKDPDPAALAPFLEKVSCELGRPLLLRRIASGGELHLGLDLRALTARLEQALRQEAAATNVAAVEQPLQTRLPQAAVAASVRGDAKKLARRLSESLGLPVAQKKGSDDARLFELDLNALTLDLVARLKARPDVEYAQPNYDMTPQKRGP
jgi:hypothetical protein